MSEATDSPTTVESANPHAAVVRKLADAMLRTAVWPGVATVVLGALLAAMWVGVPGFFGALVGGIAMSASSLLTIVLMRWTGGMDPMFVMAASLGGYFVKTGVLMMVMTMLGGVEALHTESLAFTMLATIMVWAGAEVAAFRRTKLPTIVPDSQVSHGP